MYILDGEMRISNLLVDFAYNLDYKDLPKEVIHQAKKCLLDYLGVALRGSTTQTGDKIRKFLSEFDEKGKITTIGYQRKTDILKAALINGITSHALELDDGHRGSSVHAGSAILSAVLPLIERNGIDGKTALTGIIAGYETAIRIGKAIQPSHRKLGFHSTATCGTFGVAIAASKILNLSKQQMSSALGLAGTSASGLLQFLEDGSEIKQYHPGKAAINGLLAVYLSKSGITASDNILEGKRGFLQGFSKNFDISMISQKLGKKFAIMDVYFKPYAACRLCHAPIEAVLNIQKEYGDVLNIDNISKISVFTHKSAVDGHIDPFPTTIVGAKMSIPYCIAIALKAGKAGPQEFAPNLFYDPEILNLSQKVKVEENEFYTKLVPKKRPALVEITMADGNKMHNRVDLPKGEPENPMKDKEVQKKFIELASTCRSQEEIKKIISIIKKAEVKIGEIFPYIY